MSDSDGANRDATDARGESPPQSSERPPQPSEPPQSSERPPLASEPAQSSDQPPQTGAAAPPPPPSAKPKAPASRLRRPTAVGLGGGPLVLPATRPSQRPALVVPSLSAPDVTPRPIPAGLPQQEEAQGASLGHADTLPEEVIPVPRMKIPSEINPQPKPLTPPVAPPEVLEEQAKTVAQVLGQPVRMLGGELPFYIPAAVASLALAVVSLGIGTLLTPTQKAGGAAVPAPASAPLASTVRKVSETPPPTPSTAAAERAKSAAIIKQLESLSPSQLSPEQAFTLADARATQKRVSLDKLAAHLPKQGAPSRQAVAELKAYARDPDTSHKALRVIANINDPVGPDLLYELWTGTPVRNSVTELAEALVYSKGPRSHASKALAVALDLRAAQTCEQYQEVLPRAEAEGDRRSFVVLARLVPKTGCGPKHRDDCYPCLRGGKQLSKASTAVKKRRPPAL